eukprot:jgi/Psemu1/29941/gm1.29941_g
MMRGKSFCPNIIYFPVFTYLDSAGTRFLWNLITVYPRRLKVLPIYHPKCTVNDILLLNKFTETLIVHVLNKDNYPTTRQWSKLDCKTYLLSTRHPEVDSSICLFDEMKRLSFSSLTTNTEEELPSQVNKVCYQVSLSLSIILEKYITPTTVHNLFADDSSGPSSLNKQDTHKPKHKRRPTVDTKRNSIKLPRRNSKKKGTNPQPIIDTRTLSERIPLLADSKLVTTKELRALLFISFLMSFIVQNPM